MFIKKNFAFKQREKGEIIKKERKKIIIKNNEFL